MVGHAPRLTVLARALVGVLCALALLPAAGKASITAVGQRGAGNGAGAATVDVPRPAGQTAGDVVVVSLQAIGGTALTTPAGWTQVYAMPSVSGYAAAFWKVAGAAE